MKSLLIYDSAIHPLTFDLVLALTHCKILSMRQSGQPDFDVLFWKRGYRSIGIEALYSADDQISRTVNIVPQLLCGFKPCKNKFLIDDPDEVAVARVMGGYTNIFYNKARAANPLFTSRGLERLLVSAPEYASTLTANNWIHSSSDMRRDNEIVLHVRCSKFSPERNTPYALFLDLFYLLKRVGFELSLVPDVEGLHTESPWLAWPGKTYAVAANNVFERMSVAFSAHLNILWGGGVCAPVIYSDAPYLFAGFHNRKHALCTLEYFARKGPIPLRQPIFLRGRQWWDWTEVGELSLGSLVTSIERVLSRTGT